VDLNKAIQQHTRWRAWFQQAVSSGAPMDAAILAKDNQCEMGKWLYGEAQALYGMRTAHTLCLARHAAIHVEAARVAAVLNAQCRDEAQRMLADGRSFSQASSAFILALIELENQAAAERDRLSYAPMHEFRVARPRQAGEFC
jgi:methyl-accepting chemotaxis protein